MSPCPKSCKERIFCLVGVSVVVVVLVLPTILFYSWRESEVSDWRSQTDLLEVYNYIQNCTSNVTAKENNTQVRHFNSAEHTQKYLCTYLHIVSTVIQKYSL